MDKKKYYKKLFNYFKDKKGLIVVYIITSLCIVILSTITPALTAKSLTAITETNLGDMFKYALLVLIVVTITRLVSYISNDTSSKIKDDVEIKIKEDVSSELFNLEIKNFDKEGTGFFANRINGEPRHLASIFTRIRYNLTEFLSSIGILFYVFYMNYIIGIYIILISFILFFMNKSRTKRWEEEKKKSNEIYEKYTSNFGELIRGIKDIKVLNLKDTLIKKTTHEQKNIIKYNYEIRKNEDKFFNLDFLVRNLIDFFFIIIGIILIKYNYLSGASFLIIYMYKDKCMYFVDNINDFYRNYIDYNLSIERLYELIDGTKYSKEKFGDVTLNNVVGNIEFKNTYFNYDKTEVLKGISFKIKENETIGIVGKSGVGKTTIFNLINKLYRVDNGSIFIDGVDLNELTEETLRKNISTITQEPYIFNMSIKDNLKIVNPKLTDEEMVRKCKACLLDEYVDTLPKKYDTLVGENGVILSGGLKQRLSIARALLKNSKIILLDEATSSLDNETQDFIHSSIKKIRNDYTILIIAHRLSTVIDCDKIMVIDDGKVVGFDTHDNLIKNNKIYKKLYKKELV